MMREPEPDRVFSDIPEGRESEASLREQIERLVEAKRRQDRFLDVLLHEFRNPIAAISMAAEALERFAGEAADVQAMIGVISRQSLHASRLLDELLEVSRIANGRIDLHKERIDLLGCLRAVVADRRAEFDEHRVEARLELPAQPVWIDADRARISQSLRNLLTSAIKFSRPGDQLDIKATLSKDRGRAFIELRSTDFGIAAKDLTTIFEPFYQGKAASSRATGSGLALAKGLVELHGGTLEAESEGAGKTTCFRIALPASDVEAHQGGAADATATGKKPLSILIIDDSPDVVTSLEFLLKASGHMLAAAATGKQGIEAARRLHPDVILCDIGLPDMEGYSVARQLRADPGTATVYLVAVSGYASDEDQRRSLEAGFDMHLNKPEGFVGLNERLQNLPLGR